MSNNPPKEVFNIVEGKDGKSRWVRIGAAFVNRDGSLNAFLNAFPVDGKIHIRDGRKPSQKTTEENS
jgi:hypothetical protein